MSNAHQRQLTGEELAALLHAAGIRSGEIRTLEPLTGGTFNTAYRVRLADGTALVLKVAPEPSTPILRYEQRILRTEALFYRLAGGRDTPVPTLLHAGFDQDVIDGDFLVMSHCPGSPWHSLTGRIGTSERARLRGELGRIVARLHAMTGAGFGYPSEVLAPLTPTWRTAFATMVETVLTDADRFAVRLPRPPGDIRGIVADSAAALDEVSTPVLVHFDMWDGNILLDARDGTARIGGLIDAERAFWGDPLADLVSLALFGSIEHDRAFLSGYRAGGGSVRFDAPTRRRLSLYRTYLYLIMLVEAVPRGYDDARRLRLEQRVAPLLVAELDALSARAGQPPR